MSQAKLNGTWPAAGNGNNTSLCNVQRFQQCRNQISLLFRATAGDQWRTQIAWPAHAKIAITCTADCLGKNHALVVSTHSTMQGDDDGAGANLNIFHIAQSRLRNLWYEIFR